MEKTKAKKVKVKGTQHCPRCGKDKTKLYSWRGFHFCLDCKGQLEAGSGKK